MSSGPRHCDVPRLAVIDKTGIYNDCSKEEVKSNVRADAPMFVPRKVEISRRTTVIDDESNLEVVTTQSSAKKIGIESTYQNGIRPCIITKSEKIVSDVNQNTMKSDGEDVKSIVDQPNSKVVPSEVFIADVSDTVVSSDIGANEPCTQCRGLSRSHSSSREDVCDVKGQGPDVDEPLKRSENCHTVKPSIVVGMQVDVEEKGIPEQDRVSVSSLSDVGRGYGHKISLWKGDITALQVDVIVNAANESLRGGGGVDGAIHEAAGPALMEECLMLGKCDVGEVKVTKGHQLPAKYIVHTVGPREVDKSSLEKCYWNSLVSVKEMGMKSIAFPCISTGAYGFPNKLAADVALSTVKKFMDYYRDYDIEVVFCVYSDRDEQIYLRHLPDYFINYHVMNHKDDNNVPSDRREERDFYCEAASIVRRVMPTTEMSHKDDNNVSSDRREEREFYSEAASSQPT